jgi:hypothetical protein
MDTVSSAGKNEIMKDLELSSGRSEFQRAVKRMTFPANFLYLAMSRYNGFGRSILQFWIESSSAPRPLDGGVGNRGMGTEGSEMSIDCMPFPNWLLK